MATTPFPVNAQLTAIAMLYRNPAAALIADLVSPRVQVAQQFKYTVYPAEQAYTVPDTKVGRKSQPNEVDFQGYLVPGETQNWGLDDIVPNEDIEAWDAMPKPASGGPVNPLIISTMFLEGLVQLDREIRVANQTFNTASYAAANILTLSGTSKWSDYVNSNPLYDLMTWADKTLYRPNKLVIGRAAWTILRQNPKLVQAIYGTAQNSGVIDQKQLAAKLEIDEVIVGTGWVNSARRGQPKNMVRVWGNSAAMIYTDPVGAQAGQPTFGWTGQFGTKIAGTISEPKMGLTGSERVRVGEKLIEVISAPDLGILFQNIT